MLTHIVPGDNPKVTDEMWIEGAIKHFIPRYFIKSLSTIMEVTMKEAYKGVLVDGQVDDQIIALISAGNYEAENLMSATVDVEIADSGSATVRVSTTLNADITGSGSVFYHGSPVVTRTGSGTGIIDQLSPGDLF